ncbi:hypothetical protein HGA91_05540 [candidate division WWE3 bacterium]|nr:hypothetical protein [candidate division WWE3 bacterium]
MVILPDGISEPERNVLLRIFAELWRVEFDHETGIHYLCWDRFPPFYVTFPIGHTFDPVQMELVRAMFGDDTDLLLAVLSRITGK